MMCDTGEKWYVRQKCSEKCQNCSCKVDVSGLALLL